MFCLRIFYYRHNEEEKVVDAVAIKCRKFNNDTGLYLKNTTIEGIITKFVLNARLHHVCMSWII